MLHCRLDHGYWLPRAGEREQICPVSCPPIPAHILAATGLGLAPRMDSLCWMGTGRTGLDLDDDPLAYFDVQSLPGGEIQTAPCGRHR